MFMGRAGSRLRANSAARWAWRSFVVLRRLLNKEARLNHLYDQCTIHIMEIVLDKDSCAIDVGCHTGQVLEEMIRLAPNGKHLAFEPIPLLAAKLRERFPGVSVHEMALSDKRGTAEFRHVVSRPAYSGLKERAYPNDDEQMELINVRTERLDDVVDGDARVAFIKIDVEGGEYQVLLGGERLIARCKPFVVFEHGLGAADFYGTRPEQVYDFLVDQCGLRISLLQGWLKKKPPLSREDFVTQFERHINFYFLAHP